MPLKGTPPQTPGPHKYGTHMNYSEVPNLGTNVAPPNTPQLTGRDICNLIQLLDLAHNETAVQRLIDVLDDDSANIARRWLNTNPTNAEWLMHAITGS